MAPRVWLTRLADAGRVLSAWSIGCAALAMASVLVFMHDVLDATSATMTASPTRAPGSAWAPHLEWQVTQAWAQPWRAWTAALVHYSPQHLAANLAGCAVVAAFGTAARLPFRATVAAAAAWPLTQILLLWAPGLSRYGGLSGLLHAAVAVAAVALMVQGPARQRWLGAAVWCGLLAKVLLEAPWGGAVQTVPGWDIPVAVAAHATGLVCGTFTMALVALHAALGAGTART